MKVHGFSHVYLDISHRDPKFLQHRFPAIYRRCREFGMDITTDPIPVVPAAHYLCGGVMTDLHGATAVSRLYAAGEVAMTGLHGANRLGGNSLSDLLVFGRRAGLAAAQYAKQHSGYQLSAISCQQQIKECEKQLLKPFEQRTGENPYAVMDDLQKAMDSCVGIVREEKELQKALDSLAGLKARVKNVKAEGDRTYNPGWQTCLDLENMLIVSEAITRAALERKESRGGHTRIDYPESSAEEAKWNIIIRKKGEALQVTREPLPKMPADLEALIKEGTK